MIRLRGAPVRFVRPVRLRIPERDPVSVSVDRAVAPDRPVQRRPVVRVANCLGPATVFDLRLDDDGDCRDFAEQRKRDPVGVGGRRLDGEPPDSGCLASAFPLARLPEGSRRHSLIPGMEKRPHFPVLAADARPRLRNLQLLQEFVLR